MCWLDMIEGAFIIKNQFCSELSSHHCCALIGGLPPPPPFSQPGVPDASALGLNHDGGTARHAEGW